MKTAVTTTEVCLCSCDAAELSQHLFNAGQDEMALLIFPFDNGAPPTPLTFTLDDLQLALGALAAARERGEPISPTLRQGVCQAFREAHLAGRIGVYADIA